MRIARIVLFVFFISAFAKAQQTKVNPKYPLLFKDVPATIDAESPRWISLMYAGEPNVNLIRSAYDNYYRDHKLVKSIHTQNYKHFMGNLYLNDYLQEDGSVIVPSTDQFVGKSGNSQYNQKMTGNWTQIGPFQARSSDGTENISRQSNIYAIEQSKSNPDVLISGAETGSIFVSIDHGDNWNRVADDLRIGSRQVGALDIDPTNAAIMYIGSSEKIYKSTDTGATWSQMFYTNGLGIRDFSINPSNPQEIYVAAATGLYRSISGGAISSWVRLSTDPVWDLERKPDNPDVLYAAMLNTTNNVIEVRKTINASAATPTFVAKTTGWFFPTNATALSAGGARLAVTPADADRVYALYLGNDVSGADDVNYQGLYRSDDAAETWTLPYDGDGDGVADNDPGGPYSPTDRCFSCFGGPGSAYGGGTYNQGFYNASLAVDDQDPDILLMGMLSLYKSDDGGATFAGWGGYVCDNCGGGYRHADYQEIDINGDEVWVATDGGIDLYDGVTYDLISTKTTGLNGSEFWGFGQAWQEDIVVGGRYHNGNAVYRPSYANGHFKAAGGAESQTGFVNAGNPTYASFDDALDILVPANLTDANVRQEVNATMYPNTSVYGTADRSEIVYDPVYSNIHYLGKGATLWKTEDQGLTFTAFKVFNTNNNFKVTDIEIPRSNPDVMYVTVKPNSGNAQVYRTNDKGVTWNELTLPAGHPNTEMQVASDDEDEIYMSFERDYGATDKVFKSLDGGVTWINLTTPTLNRRVTHLVIQDGTDGGVYAITFDNVFYRNSNMVDWVAYGEGISALQRFSSVLPFYRDGKLRGATYREGVIETPFFEPSTNVIAQPITNKKTYNCAREEIQFEDYSVMNYNGATWQWSFPGASYVSDVNARNPKVRYSVPGEYDVTLTITDANGNTDTKTIPNMVELEEDICATVDVEGPNKALYQGSGSNHLSGEDFNLDNVTNLSVSAWIKPNVGGQSDFAGIFGAYDDTDDKNFSLNIRSSGEVRMFYKGTRWQWSTGLFINEGEWNYVAIVVTPTTYTIYLNDEKATTSNSVGGSFNMDAFVVGSHVGRNGRNYKGYIDEVKVWDRELSEDEIRGQRHLISPDLSDPNLQAYWQFNDDVNEFVYDLKNGKDLNYVRTPQILPSTAPVGPGVSEKMSITSAGVYDYASAKAKLDFTGSTIPNGDVWVSKLEIAPDQNPQTTPVLDTYWIINNYGDNAAVTSLASLELGGFDNLGVVANASDMRLYERHSNGDLATWSNPAIEFADTFDVGSETITYSNPIISALGQLYVGEDLSTVIKFDEVKTSFDCAPLKGTLTDEYLEFTLNGRSLMSDITITSNSPVFTISLDPNTGYTNNLNVPAVSGETVDVPIYIKAQSSIGGLFSTDLTLSTAGLSPFNQEVAATFIDGANGRGDAMSMTASNQYVEIDMEGLSSNTFTVEFWIKPNSLQDFNQWIGSGWGNFGFHVNDSGRVYIGVSTSKRFVTGNNTLEVGKWTHISYTQGGGIASLYINGNRYGQRTGYPTPQNFGTFRLGTDGSHGNSTFTLDAEIDEFRFFTKSRTKKQIQENMHVVYNLDNACDEGLQVYYQFDNVSGNVIENAIGGYAGEMFNTPTLVESSAPVGKGFAQTKYVNAAGTYDFDLTNVQMDFTTTIPGGDIVVSRIDEDAFALPTTSGSLSGSHWIIENYAPNTTVLNADVTFSELNFVTTNSAVDYNYLSREKNGFGVYEAPVTASSVNSAQDEVTFFGVNEFKQFYLETNQTLVYDYIFQAGQWSNDPLGVNPSTLNDDVQIMDGTITINSPFLSKNFIVDAGATVFLNQDVTVSNNLILEGAIQGEGFVELDNQVVANIIDVKDVNATVENLKISSVLGATLSSTSTVSGALNITGVLDLNAGGMSIGTGNPSITFKSSAAKTGQVIGTGGDIDTNIDINVERYIPSRRAYRFLTSSVSGSSIFDAWQETSLNAAGLGTHITGMAGSPVGLSDPTTGLDYTVTGNSSMFSYDASLPAWQAVDNTKTTMLNAGDAYRLMVRGDRTVDLTSNSASSSPTVLRASGDLLQSDVTINTIPGYNFIGNPFQSYVNMANVSITGATGFVYYFDPNMGDLGAYTTISLPGGVATGGSNASHILEPGQSFFVESTSAGTVSFEETDKVTYDTQYIFNTPNTSQFLKLNLYEAGRFNNQEPAQDGIIINFNSVHNDGIDRLDASKVSNINEDLSIVHYLGEELAFESRTVPAISETIPLHLSKHAHSSYVFDAYVDIIPGRTVFLKDNLDGSMTELIQGQSTFKSFTVDTSIPASLDINRFELVFNTVTLSNDVVEDRAISIYPNPVKSGAHISFANVNEPFVFTLYDAAGKVVAKQEIANQSFNIGNLAQGFYFYWVETSTKMVSGKLIVE